MNRRAEAEKWFQKAAGLSHSFASESLKQQNENNNEKSHTGLFGFLKRIFKGH